MEHDGIIEFIFAARVLGSIARRTVEQFHALPPKIPGGQVNICDALCAKSKVIHTGAILIIRSAIGVAVEPQRYRTPVAHADDTFRLVEHVPPEKLEKILVKGLVVRLTIELNMSRLRLHIVSLHTATARGSRDHANNCTIRTIEHLFASVNSRF